MHTLAILRKSCRSECKYKILYYSTLHVLGTVLISTEHWPVRLMTAKTFHFSRAKWFVFAIGRENGKRRRLISCALHASLSPFIYGGVALYVLVIRLCHISGGYNRQLQGKFQRAKNRRWLHWAEYCASHASCGRATVISYTLTSLLQSVTSQCIPPSCLTLYASL